MKKIILVVIAVMIFVVTGCGKTKANSNLSNYMGAWGNNDSSIPDEEIVITKMSTDEIVFDYYLFRLTSFESIKAKLDGNLATFQTKNDLGWELGGTIELKDNKIILNKTDSSNGLIEKGIVEFKYKESESILKGNKETTNEKINEVKENQETNKEKSNNETSSFNINNYVGVWRNDDSSNPVDELIISAPKGNSLPFEYLIDGIGTFENGNATLNHNKADFNVKNDLDWSLKGYFIMENNQVTLTITSSSNENISPATTTYTLHRDKSNLK